MNEWKDVNISDMMGKTFVSVENINNEELSFITTDGTEYKMYHDQD